MPVLGSKFATDIHLPLAENFSLWRHYIAYFIVAVFSTLMNQRPSCLNFSTAVTDVNYESATIIWKNLNATTAAKYHLSLLFHVVAHLYFIECWNFPPLLNWLSLVSESTLPTRHINSGFYNHQQFFNPLKCTG